ncbi:hypothetical protein Agub_g5258 [Astrephomene gubernaculifera]|uniref:Anticodon-binding domain-containing protein n=1 Tax=Astrephomene gubernaculifera TaxID=47775 RepID=A0AAD3DM23_9CHLO|nr:hypothetical protein Agub_g5258 [Astrephomene gubernaculifera]
MAPEGVKIKKEKKASAPAEDGNKLTDAKRKRDSDAAQPSEGAAEQAAKQPASDAQAAPAADKAAGGPPRKKRRGPKADPEQLNPEEAARRQRQRELRERAMQLRSQGKHYIPLKKGGKHPKPGDGSSAGAKQQQADGGNRKARHYLGDKTPGWRPFSSVEAIVLPIYWNNDKEEKASVIAAAERARDILASAGIAVDMDASNKYTPGQKMKYWETMGVRVRVELGPRDVANGNCVVALSTKKPGEVAVKDIVNMRHKMLDAVREALKKAKSAALEAEEEEEEERQQQVEEGGKQQQQGKEKAKKASKEDEEDEEEGEEEGEEEEEEAAQPKEEESGEEKAATEAPAPASKQPFSADALEDDFGAVVEFEPEEDKLTLSKKERLKKGAKLVKEKRKAERRTVLAGGGGGGSEEPEEEGGRGVGVKEGGWGKGGKAAAPKKPKVVKF